jgi:hypothetical protein
LLFEINIYDSSLDKIDVTLSGLNEGEMFEKDMTNIKKIVEGVEEKFQFGKVN